MEIIPVIDLKDGLVVHAVRGERKHYQAIHLHSCLVADSRPETVIAAFLNLYPFQTFYIADLDAIMACGDNLGQILALLNRYPQLGFWVDDGGRIETLNRLDRLPNQRTVIGTESQSSLSDLGNWGKDFILSLDYKDNREAGPSLWFRDAGLWPEQVIVMTLNRVGSQTGPDFNKLAELVAAYPLQRFVAAGGVRDVADLMRLSELGIAAVLLATALHDGSLSAADIADLQAKKYPGKPRYF